MNLERFPAISLSNTHMNKFNQLNKQVKHSVVQRPGRRGRHCDDDNDNIPLRVNVYPPKILAMVSGYYHPRSHFLPWYYAVLSLSQYSMQKQQQFKMSLTS